MSLDALCRRLACLRQATALMLIGLILTGSASAAERFDVFFLVVGSGNYVTPHEAGVRALPDIHGATKSAKLVASLLDQGGSTFGVTLVSDVGRFVSREDINQALGRVGQEIQDTKPRRPLLVFYFAGHGIAEGTSWFEYLLPGNFAYRGNITAATDNGAVLEESTVLANDLVAALRRMNIAFLVLLDTCYEGTSREFFWKPIPPADCPKNDIIDFCGHLEKQIEGLRSFDAQMAETAKKLNEMTTSFREMNRFEDTYPIIFSTDPGKTVSTVADPRISDPRGLPVAPLARRATLILDPILKHRESLSLAGFIAQMVSPDFDRSVTGPGVTHSPMPANAELLLVSTGATRGRAEFRVGTATTAAICCGGASR
jgi:hypothetical protein